MADPSRLLLSLRELLSFSNLIALGIQTWHLVSSPSRSTISASHYLHAIRKSQSLSMSSFTSTSLSSSFLSKILPHIGVEKEQVFTTVSISSHDSEWLRRSRHAGVRRDLWDPGRFSAIDIWICCSKHLAVWWRKQIWCVWKAGELINSMATKLLLTNTSEIKRYSFEHGGRGRLQWWVQRRRHGHPQRLSLVWVPNSDFGPNSTCVFIAGCVFFWIWAFLQPTIMSSGLLGFRIWDPGGLSHFQKIIVCTIGSFGVVLKEDSNYYVKRSMECSMNGPNSMCHCGYYHKLFVLSVHGSGRVCNGHSGLRLGQVPLVWTMHHRVFWMCCDTIVFDSLD